MQKLKFVAATILGTTLSIGVVANMPIAQAASLIPQQEGEIQLSDKDGNKINCIASNCFDTKTYGYTVKSLPYDFDSIKPQLGISRLFVDKNGTENTWGSGVSQVQFGKKDAGTNPKEFWLRPVAYLAQSAYDLPTGTPDEQSQAEVGKFLFEFDKIANEVTLNFFDVEESGFSGILEVNGSAYSDLIPAKGDSNIQSRTLKNVKSMVLQLGKPAPTKRFGNYADGVRLSVSVPEPGTTVSLGALAVAGLFGLRQRKKVSRVG